MEPIRPQGPIHGVVPDRAVATARLRVAPTLPWLREPAANGAADVTPDGANGTPDEARLITAAKGGDLAAFGELVAPHHQTAFRLAYHLTHDPGEAEDAVQEGMIRAFRSMSKFRDEAPLRPWLLKIVTNEARSRVRVRSRSTRLFGRLSAFPLNPAPDPVFEVLASETRDELAACLTRLPAIHRDVILLRFFLELNEREMADVLSCAPGTVKSRLSRAIVALRHDLEQAARAPG